MERSTLAYLAVAAVAVLWMLLAWPNLQFGNKSASGLVHGVIVAAISWGGFYCAVLVERKHGRGAGEGH